MEMETEMEMEFYVNTGMHVYVYVCVCARYDSCDYSYTSSMSRSHYRHTILVPPNFIPRIGISEEWETI